MRNYGGGPQQFNRQLKAKVSLSGQEAVEGYLQVKSKAPVELLLHSDFLKHLGFMVIEPKMDGMAAGLLQKRKYKVSRACKPVMEDPQVVPKPANSPRVEVCLLQATQIPPRHAKMVHAKIADPTWKEPLSLFEPSVDIQKEHEFFMEEAVVDPDLDHRVCVMIENDKNYPVKLKKGSLLGTVVTVKEMKQENAEDDTPANMADPSNYVASIQAAAGSQPTGREKRLLKTLHINQESLTKEEVTQLAALILEYADIFAINPSDLSTTDRITYTIETGDQRPIQQPPRHVPFALWDQVNKMVQVMLDRGIVEPWVSPIVLVEKKRWNSLLLC